jgi:hypothetical protein
MNRSGSRSQFDAKNKRMQIPMLKSVLPTSPVSAEQIEQFVTQLDECDNEHYSVFYSLARMSSAQRLTRNLKTFLDILTGKDVQSVVNDGLHKKDRAALLSLENTKYSTEHKEVAQSLLNVDERYQALQVFGTIYRHERRKT